LHHATSLYVDLSDCYLDKYGGVNFPILRQTLGFGQLTRDTLVINNRFVQENTFTLYKTVLSLANYHSDSLEAVGFASVIIE